MTDNELPQAIYNDTQVLKQTVSSIENRGLNIENQLSNIENRRSNIENQLSAIKLTLVNETRVNIKRVAEGHLDLSRDLKEAKKTNNEIEMLAVRVNMLESNTRELKHRIS